MPAAAAPKKSGPPVVLSDEQRTVRSRSDCSSEPPHAAILAALTLSPVRARQDIKEAFDLFDVDETGVISTDDLMVTLRAMGFEPSPTQLQAMVVAVGGDPQATTVTEEQFFKIMTNKMEEVSSHEETCQAFRMFEPSGQSAEEGPMVTAEDVERITEMLGLQDNDSASRIQGMIRDADVSGTGEVSLTEFIRITNLRANTG